MLTGKQKKYLLKNVRKENLAKLSKRLDVPKKEILAYFEKRWSKGKFQKYLKSYFKQNNEKKTNHFKLRNFVSFHKKELLFLVTIVLISYINTLNNDFVSDDVAAIQTNPNLPTWHNVIVAPQALIRPFLNYSIYHLFGLKPWAFRIINILFHLGTVLIVYYFISLLINKAVGFLTASILAVHPLQIEAVSWISGGPYSQYSFFLMSSLLSYYLFIRKRKVKYYFISILLYFLSLQSSERAAVLPIMIFAFLLAYKKFKKYWLSLIPFITLSGFWVLIFMGIIKSRVTILQSDYYQNDGTINPLFKAVVAFSSYLGLALFPKNLTLYHSELSFSIYDFVFRVVIVVILGTLSLLCFKKQKHFFFWPIFFAVSLLPTLTPFNVTWVVAERYVYLGSIGLYVVFSLIVYKLIKKISNYKNLHYNYWTVLLILVIMLSLRTIARNIDWDNQDNLWLSAAKTSPSSPQNHNNLGDLYTRQKNYQKAIEEFNKAIQLNPNYADAYHNLANTFLQSGQPEKAIASYQKSLEINPTIWQSHLALGAIYFDQKDYQQAKSHILEAISIKPNNPDLYSNLGLIYLKIGDYEKAVSSLNKALEIDPNNNRAKDILINSR